MAFLLKSILSDMSIATTAFLSFPLAWNIFSHLLTFSLYVSFVLSWVSCRQHTVGSCFFLQPATLCLLLGAFSPLAFKAIIDKCVFIALLNLVFQLTLRFSFVPFFLYLDDCLLFYACVLCFLVFVNVTFGCHLRLPCFSDVLTPSHICCFSLMFIEAQTHYKNKSLDFRRFLPHILWLWSPFVTSSCVSFCCSLCLSSLSQYSFFLLDLHTGLFKALFSNCNFLHSASSYFFFYWDWPFQYFF